MKSGNGRSRVLRNGYGVWKFAPHPRLEPYIRHLVYARVEAPELAAAGGKISHLGVPCGSGELLLIAKGTVWLGLPGETLTRYNRSFVFGPCQRAVLFEVREPATFLSAELQPAALSRLYPDACREIVDYTSGLDILLPGVTARLEDAFAGQESLPPGLATLEQHLLEMFRTTQDPHPIVRETIDHIEREFQSVKIKELAASLGMSIRRMHQIFDEQVGVSPKVFQQITRVRAAYKSMIESESPDWAAVVYKCGYVDQAHLCHEIKQYTSLTPAQFASHRSSTPQTRPPGADTP